MKKKNVNIRTIAQMAGVSIASVSRALQEPPSPKISEVQRKHILDICSAMHYYPNAHTRRMFTRKSNTIAFLFPPQDDAPQQQFRQQNPPMPRFSGRRG